MIYKLEILPNEILLDIFSYLSWDEILTSLWPINQRMKSLVCSILSMNKNGLIFNKPGLSYRKFSRDLLRLILSSLFLSSSIKYFHCDGINSIPFDFIYQEIFYHNDKPRICFPNLESVCITQCFLSEPLIQILSSLVKHQLNDLTLSIHKDFYDVFYSEAILSKNDPIRVRRIHMIQQILRQIFSNQCQLISVQLNICDSRLYSTDYLQSSNYPSLNIPTDTFQTSCLTLHRLKIRLYSICLLHDLIEHVPNLEQLSVHCEKLRSYRTFPDSNMGDSLLLDGNWIDKIPKLKCFTLKSYVNNDSEFVYLKWLLNNVNHIIKLHLELCSQGLWSSNQDKTIWNFMINADFIRQYCLPDEIIHLKCFHFYIRAERPLLMNNSEEIINSFQIHPFFIDHQWTNVQCFYDDYQNKLYQHIFSSNVKEFEWLNLLIDHPCIDHKSDMHHIKILLDPLLCSFIEQFNELCPNTSYVTMFPVNPRNDSEILSSLEMELRMKRNNILFRNVTKLRFGTYHSRLIGCCREFTDNDIIIAKIFAHIISMCVQIKYLFINRFEWLLYIARYASDDLRPNALNTVHHAEFCIASCNVGMNDSIRTGQYMVSFLGTFMPHLQSLCLWRPDDFPWTSLRPDFTRRRYGVLICPWRKSLYTPESIAQHVTIFKQDLCQLFERLRELVYLNIYAETSNAKIEPYRLMVQTCFSNSRFDIRTSRFRLWI